jgi:hypothetical protein
MCRSGASTERWTLNGLQTVLQRTPLEEKQRLRARMQEDGCYKGFKLRQYYEYVKANSPPSLHVARESTSEPLLTPCHLRMENGVKDKIEQFNWFRDMKSQEFPSTIQPYLDEVKEFSARMHNDVFLNLMRREYSASSDLGGARADGEFKLWRLGGMLTASWCSQSPSNCRARPSLSDINSASTTSRGFAVSRFAMGCVMNTVSVLTAHPSIDMAYYDEHTKEDESKVKGVWLKGHQDFGSECGSVTQHVGNTTIS